MLECSGIPIEDLQSAVILLRSPTEESYLGTEIPKPADSKTVINVPIGAIAVEFKEPHKTEFSIMFQTAGNLVILSSEVNSSMADQLRFKADHVSRNGIHTKASLQFPRK